MKQKEKVVCPRCNVNSRGTFCSFCDKTKGFTMAEIMANNEEYLKTHAFLPSFWSHKVMVSRMLPYDADPVKLMRVETLKSKGIIAYKEKK